MEPATAESEGSVIADQGRRPAASRVRARGPSLYAEPDPAVAGRRREQRGTASQSTQEVLERIDDCAEVGEVRFEIRFEIRDDQSRVRDGDLAEQS